MQEDFGVTFTSIVKREFEEEVSYDISLILLKSIIQEHYIFLMLNFLLLFKEKIHKKTSLEFISKKLCGICSGTYVQDFCSGNAV